jgi:signal recognition particle receptor subunit beta
MPLLVLANKMDKEGHMTATKIVESMNLDYIDDHKWKILPISARNGTNMDQAVEWIMKTSQEFTESSS